MHGKPHPISPYFPALDGVRAVAILLVILVHSLERGPPTPTSGISTIERLYYRLAYFGWSGVDLFFVLSGFLITGILLDTKGGHGYLRAFYARRFLRIIPLYYFALLLTFVVLRPTLSEHFPAYSRLAADQVWFWCYAPNWLIAFGGLPSLTALNHLWSLGIEEQFYLVWPLAILVTPSRSAAKLCVGVALSAVVFRTALVWQQSNPIGIYVSTFSRLDALAIGGWLAATARQPGGLHQHRGRAAYALVLLGPALVALMVAKGPQGLLDPLVQSLGYSAVAVFYGACLLGVLTASSEDRLIRFLTAYPMRWLGRVSYAAYIFHWPMMLLIAAYWPWLYASDESVFLHHLLFFGCSVTATTLVAVVSWHLLEKRMLGLKRYFQVDLT